MMDIASLLSGLVAGAFFGGLIIYLLAYRTLLVRHHSAQMSLTEAQTKNNELQATLMAEQAKAYQQRQTELQHQKQLETHLNEAGERYAELEKRLADLEAQYAQEQQGFLRETTRLRGAITRLEQEQVALQDRHAQETARWDMERQSMGLQGVQVEEELRGLRQDKLTLGRRLEQQQESWEQERLALQIQMNTMESQLSVQQGSDGQGGATRPASEILARARAEVASEWQRRETGWNTEREALQRQVEQLQAEKAALRAQAESAAALAQRAAPNPAESADLRQLFDQAQRERQILEDQLLARNRQAEQERSALEGEIEQLMERLLRLQNERRR